MIFGRFRGSGGLTEYQENEFYDQPYRVVKKTRVITETYYETLEGTEVTM